jgi:ribosomal protein S2
MKEYIFGERNGIYIIDLQKTQRMFREAIAFVTNLIAEDKGKTVLFVGTKRQAQDAIREEAEKCGQYYVNQRWLGGLLTNFQTVQKSIKRLKDLESMQTDGRYEKMTKKERIKLDRERESLNKNLSGIKSMTRLPDAVFIIDVKKEEIAVAEANRLGTTTPCARCACSHPEYLTRSSKEIRSQLRVALFLRSQLKKRLKVRLAARVKRSPALHWMTKTAAATSAARAGRRNPHP